MCFRGAALGPGACLQDRCGSPSARRGRACSSPPPPAPSTPHPSRGHGVSFSWGAHTHTPLSLPPPLSHLDGSASGPNGDMDSSRGEEPRATSASRERDSFLSRPASLPEERDGGRVGGRVRARGAGGRRKKEKNERPHPPTSPPSPRTGIRFQLARHHAVTDVHMVQEGVDAVRAGKGERERGRGRWMPAQTGGRRQLRFGGGTIAEGRPRRRWRNHGHLGR